MMNPIFSATASTMRALVRVPDNGMVGPPFIRRIQTIGMGLIRQ
jgi:hypothetical protein